MIRKSVGMFPLLFFTVSVSWAWSARPDVHQALARLPLRFETAANGTLLARAEAYGLLVEPGQTTLRVTNPRNHTAASVITRIIGADPLSRPSGADPLQARANYFLGYSPAAWRSGVALYSRAVYRHVYPGIDLAFHGTAGLLEYDFVVAPGADAGSIALEISGGSSIRLDPDGALAIATSAGTIRWNKPVVYQWNSDGRQLVPGRFRLSGTRVTFAIGKYDHSRELVIDPTLAYATYLGGSLNEGGRGVAVDSAGDLYVTGFTSSTNLAVTSGSFQTTYKGGSVNNFAAGDVFIAKYSSAGSLVYLTYLGGKGDDVGTAIAVDPGGSVYVTGYTSSTDFPTVAGSYQTTYGGGSAPGMLTPTFGDAFAVKLSPAGNTLVYSTYLGGSADEKGLAIVVDSAGNAYVAGSTLSFNFPVKNAYQAAFKGSGGQPNMCATCGPVVNFGDGFLVKLNADGKGVAFSTYFGGSADDAITSIALDTLGNVYAGGNTVSSDFPVLGAAQAHFGGMSSDSAQPFVKVGDGFVAKFTPAGTLVYSTYLGGSGDDAVMGIAVDGAGAVYATGFTVSPNFPGIGTNAAQKTLAGPQAVSSQQVFAWGDAFVAKLAPAGNGIVYATYLGGSQNDAGMAIKVDGAGNAIVGGFANSTDLKVTADALQKVFGGNGPAGFTDTTGDGFLAKISADGSSILYLSYYGGSSSDIISALALGTNGNIVAGGATTSPNLPITATAAQKSFAGFDPQAPSETMGDAFVAVFSGIVTNPFISDIQNGASFAPGAVANSWLTIKGGLLASATDTWWNSIVNDVLPTTLDGVTVTVSGQPAYIYYISPSQINVVAPNIAAGPTTVTVKNPAGTAVANATAQVYGPAFFLWPGGYAVATHQDFSYAIKNGTFTGISTAPAQPGSVLILWGMGFGPTTPAAPVGVNVPLNSYSVNNVTVTVGGLPATVYGTALAPGWAALFQVAIQVPPSLADGDYPVVATVNNVSSPATTLITVKH